MTYLSFGVLMGTSASVAYFGYFESSIEIGTGLQILISVTAAIAAGLSAHAAHSVSEVTKETHQRLLEASATRKSAAKKLLLNLAEILEQDWERKTSILTFGNSHWFEPAEALLDKALDEPLNEDEYMSIWDARSVIRRMQNEHSKHDGIIQGNRDGYIEKLRELASAIR